MFLRKIFSSENKFAWVVIDLLIVIIGVYCAFLIQSYAEDQKTEKEKDKILAALKFELEFFRIEFPGRASYSADKAKEWKVIYDSGRYNDFSTWRFIEPQYNYQVLELAINTDNTEIIDFDLYQALQRLYVQIKRIEHTEQLLTDIGISYQAIPSSLRKNSKERDIIWATNYVNFQRMIQFMFDRAGNQDLLGSESKEALTLVNDRLNPERRRKVEEELIVANLDRAQNEEHAVLMVKELFPNFTEEETRTLYRRSQDAADTSPTN